MPTATFNQGTRIALEVDRSTAPSTTNTRTNGPGGPWWAGGGKWFDIVTEGLPGVQEKQAVIFPKATPGSGLLISKCRSWAASGARVVWPLQCYPTSWVRCSWEHWAAYRRI